MTTFLAKFWIRGAVVMVGLLAGPLAQAAIAQTFTVPGSFPTIQGAINAVPSGATINVQAGTYLEALRVVNTSRSLTVRAVGGAVIVDAVGKGAAALTVSQASGQVVFVGLTFRRGSGGGFMIQASSPSFFNCIFESNSAFRGAGGQLIASNAIFNGCTIQGNSAAHFGGGLYIIANSRPVFTSCSIINNASGTGGQGGGGNDGAGGGVFSHDSSPTFRGSRINGNTSTFASGGIHHQGVFGSSNGRSMLVVEDSEVANNVSSQFPGMPNPSEGGGIHVEDFATGTLTRARIHDNSAGTGGGLGAYRGRYDIVDSVIESNHALVNFGGGIAASSNFATPQAPGSIVNLTRTLVRNNTAPIAGGIVTLGDNFSSEPARLSLTSSVVNNNTSQTQGGGILATKTILTATNSLIIRNTVSGGGGGAVGGGIMVATNSSATINTTTIAHNTAQSHGGGLFVNDNTVINMTGSNVYANTATGGRGGGLFIGTSTQSGTISGSTFADNNSSSSGQTNAQIQEDACSSVIYQNNTVTPTPPSVQFAGCFTTQSGSGGRVTGTNSNPPRFAHFLAVPGAGTSSTLAWSVARATSVTISGGVGTFTSPTNSPTGTADVTPASSTTYSLTAVASAANGGNYGAVNAGFISVPPPPPPPSPPMRHIVDGDFDGDRKADIALFRPSTGVWYVRGISTVTWGGWGDVPVAGDYDGDGKSDIAVFRPSTSVWYIRNGSTVTWGGSGDIPVIGDYDGDGKSDIAIFRPSTGVWYIRNGSTVTWGGTGDIPVVGDYDGDGRSDIAVFRPSTGVWYVLGASATTWGGTGDIPVVGDYDGDGKSDIAVFRPSTGAWYILGLAAVTYGGSGDIPVPGDYNGDGKTDIAIFRPSTGAWFVTTLGAAVTWGGSGDIPILRRP